jgi:hypothetical protein
VVCVIFSKWNYCISCDVLKLSKCVHLCVSEVCTSMCACVGVCVWLLGADVEGIVNIQIFPVSNESLGISFIVTSYGVILLIINSFI